MRDLYSNDVETAAELASFEELPAECDDDRDYVWLDEHDIAREDCVIPVDRSDFLRDILDGTPELPF